MMEENQDKDKEVTPEEIGLQEDSASVSSTPPAALPETPVRRESRARSFGRTLLYSLLLAAIAFAAGLAVEYFVFLKPQMVELQSIAAASNEKVDQLTTERDKLQDQVAALQPLADESQQAQMHVTLLSALNDITTAHLELEQGDPAAAKLVLAKTSKTLDTLKSQMEPDTRQVIVDMQTRLGNTINIMERDPEAAISDFSVLENNLRTIENNLFME
jgi:cell division protein FtsL